MKTLDICPRNHMVLIDRSGDPSPLSNDDMHVIYRLGWEVTHKDGKWQVFRSASHPERSERGSGKSEFSELRECRDHAMWEEARIGNPLMHVHLRERGWVAADELTREAS